jgi:polysaccharide export outer membrane protein
MKYLSFGFIALLCLRPMLHAQSAQAAKPVERASAVQSPTPDADAQPAIPLHAGDTVEIRIANVPLDDIQQWDAPYTLDETGMLNLPFIGMIKAGGLPPSQVQTMIQNKLIAEGIYTSPTIAVNPPSGMRFVSVGGAVRAPGRIPYTSDLTLMSTLSAAGGPSDFAGDQIRLIRSGKVILYSRKKLEKDPSKDPRVQPSDQVELKESAF